jgi:hypothetical protein
MATPERSKLLFGDREEELRAFTERSASSAAAPL